MDRAHHDRNGRIGSSIEEAHICGYVRYYRQDTEAQNASRILSEAEKDTLHEKGWLGEMAIAALHLLCPERVRVQGTTNEEGEILLRENYRGGSHSIWHKLDQDIHMNILNMPNIVPVRHNDHYWQLSFGDGKLTEEQLEEERGLALSFGGYCDIEIKSPLESEHEKEVCKIWAKYEGCIDAVNQNMIHDEEKAAEVVASLPSGARGSEVGILGKHIARMNPGNWLFDEVINQYMWILQARDNHRTALQQLSCGSGKKPSLFLQSYFASFLIGGGVDFSKAMGVIKKKIKALNNPGISSIFDLGKIVVPINHDNAHWALIVASFEREKVLYFDAGRRLSRQSGKAHRQALLSLLKNEAGKLGVDFRGWTDEAAEAPVQQNGTDCGAFVCAFASYITHALDIRSKFSQGDITAIRQRITYDLLHACEEFTFHGLHAQNL